MSLNFVENFKIINGVINICTGAPITTDTISLKYAQKCWIVVKHDCAGGAGMLITPQRDVTVAAAASVVLANVVPVWQNANCNATDTLVRGADALNATTAGAAVPQMVVFEIDPASLGGVYDCINVLLGAIANTDSVDVTFYIQSRYPQATPPSMIVN